MAMTNAEREAGPEVGQDPPDPVRPGRGREIAFRVVAGVFALGAIGGLFGIGLVIGWFDNDAGGIHRVHDIGFGVLYGALLATAAVALAVRPDTPSAFWQVVAVGVASVLGGALSTNADVVMLGAFVLVAAAILFALHPALNSVLHPGFRPSPVLGALALLGAVPLVGLGLAAARLQRAGPAADPHVHEGHWAIMASMAFGLVLCGLLAAARTRGWRVTAWSAGLGLAIYGLASVVFARIPGTDVPYAGSEGVGWGLAAIAGGLVFVAVAEWQARSDPNRSAPVAEPGAARA